MHVNKYFSILTTAVLEEKSCTKLYNIQGPIYTIPCFIFMPKNKQTPNTKNL